MKLKKFWRIKSYLYVTVAYNWVVNCNFEFGQVENFQSKRSDLPHVTESRCPQESEFQPHFRFSWLYTARSNNKQLSLIGLFTTMQVPRRIWYTSIPYPTGYVCTMNLETIPRGPNTTCTYRERAKCNTEYQLLQARAEARLGITNFQKLPSSFSDYYCSMRFYTDVFAR